MKQIKDLLRLTSRHGVLVFAFAVILVSALCLGLSSQKVVNADGTTPRTDLPSDIQCQVANYDDSTSYLNKNCPGYSEDDLCDPYPAKPAGLDPGYFEWLTPQGADNGASEQTQDGTDNVTAGTQSVYLDYDSLVYVCHHAVAGNVDYSTDATPVSPYSIVRYGDTTPTTAYLPTDQQYYISTTSSAYTSGPDPVSSISFNNGTTVDIPSSTTSRFWRAGNLPFVVNLAKPLKTSENVVVNIIIAPISEFSTAPGSPTACVDGGTYNPTGGTAGWHNTIFGLLYDGCESYTISEQISVTIPVQVQSNVFTVNPDGSSQAQVPGVTFDTCGYDSTQSRNNQNGYYYFTVPAGYSYCNRILSTPYSSSSPVASYLPPSPTYPSGARPFIPGYDGPFTRPYNMGDGSEDAYPSIATLGDSVCGPYGASGLQDHCPTNTYECQVAGIYSNPDACGYSSLDRASDSGEDFNYVGLNEQCQTGSPPCTTNTNPASPTCSISPSSSNIQPGSKFSVSYTIHNDAQVTPLTFTSGGGSPYYVTFGGSGSIVPYLQTPPQAAGGTVTINPGNSYTSPGFSITAGSAGQYSVSMDVYADSPSNDLLANCSGTITISNNPYLRVFGGDVFDGTDSADVNSCFDGGSNSAVYSYNSNTSNIGTGAGTDTAVLDTGGTSNQLQFTSGQGHILSLFDPLTFANSPIKPPPDYGGGFNTSPESCSGQPDHYSQVRSLSNAVQCPSVISAATFSALGLPVSGNTVKLGPGNSYICYSSSSVEVTANIAYNLSGATANNLPVFEMVVNGGDINIVNNQQAPLAGEVTELAGSYIAQDGTICDNYHTAAGFPTGCYVDESSTSANVQNTSPPLNKLTINGAFVAKQLDLYRSYGSVDDDTTATNSPPDNYASEEFDYSPINWLSPGPEGQAVVQSVTGLPPVY